jgi:phenylalanyl-tRNA synthetase beta chain
MLISKKWLDTYVEGLPSMEKIADILLLHSFEIEGSEKIEGDDILDIDVLPNRAHDCLCHEGVAKEIAGILELSSKEQRERFDEIPESLKSDFSQKVILENKKQCKRYIATPVKNVKVKESPDWLVSRLKSMGQKSINNLVDATNYILFDQGQPMHIFDADKVQGSIIVRNAKDGESMLTLTGEEIHLKEDDLVIADEEKILALAGIKGGKAAEVDENTKNIIIESANFDSVLVRKTARRVKIYTDASKRYENGISSEKAMTATKSLLSLIFELASTNETLFGKSTDLYPQFEEEYQLSFTREKTEAVLGFPIKDEEIQKILDNFSYSYVFHD